MIMIAVFLVTLIFVLCSLCPLWVTDEMQDVVKLAQ